MRITEPPGDFLRLNPKFTHDSANVPHTFSEMKRFDPVKNIGDRDECVKPMPKERIKNGEI